MITKDNIYYVDDNNNYNKGWQTIDGNKYYFKNDGSAVKKTTIGGKCLGTFTGWSKSKRYKYYYKKGILQTGWITVKYYAAKNGVIRTVLVTVDEAFTILTRTVFGMVRPISPGIMSTSLKR